MKKILMLLILLVLGCKDKDETEFTKEQKQRKENIKIVRSYTDRILENDTEKLALLSILKKIPNDTLHLVLNDYLNKTAPFIDKNTQVEKIIDTISHKYHISKFKIASIIFSYKYEMLTKEEIEESAIESYQADNPE